MKKIISMVLSFILILGCSTTAFAAETHNYDTENLPHDGADYLKRKLKLMRKMKNAFLILLPYMVINIPKVV